jgi:hypothetical protein
MIGRIMNPKNQTKKNKYRTSNTARFTGAVPSTTDVPVVDIAGGGVIGTAFNDAFASQSKRNKYRYPNYPARQILIIFNLNKILMTNKKGPVHQFKI